MGGITYFDKAWLAPALAKWLEVGIVQYVEHTFNYDIPDSVEGYILLGLTSVFVYFMKNAPKVPAAPAAPAA